jgi:hypothetical protein
MEKFNEIDFHLKFKLLEKVRGYCKAGTKKLIFCVSPSVGQDGACYTFSVRSGHAGSAFSCVRLFHEHAKPDGPTKIGRRTWPHTDPVMRIICRATI